MSINKLEVIKIMKSAGISCDPNELKSYVNDLSKIVVLFKKLKELNTNNIEPLYNTNNDTLKLREDRVIKQNKREDIMSNVSKSKQGFYVVPKII